MQSNASVTMLDTSIIIPNKYQPRKVFDEEALNTLAESIKNYGIINPILVRKKEDKYEIIAGERRFRAAKQLGLTQIPVIIKDANEQQMAELALIENLQRQGLSPIEEAKSYEEIMRIGNQTQENLAKKIGKSQAAIANKIRLLSLPQEIQDALANKKISERHARSLISVKDKNKQIDLLNRIIKERLTVKETEKIINSESIEEEEIKKAISDIMKSLNIKEEEKEDDNMNNGSFFPNFDNNNAGNNNTSLNMMNMQSMNQQPVDQGMTMAPMNNQMPEQSGMVAPLPMEQPPMQPMTDMNSLNSIPSFMTPQDNNFMPQPMQMNEPQQTPMMNDAPLFGPAIQPSIEPQAPMMDAPLFNPNATMASVDNMNQPNESPMMAPNAFEIPVVNNDTSMITPQTQDKLAQLQEYLNTNGYTYKLFNNETENCIIIEIPRN